MKDRVAVNPGRVLITPESGSPYYATLARADNPTQEGDPLNKNTLLKDTTAALFGLGAEALPDDVLKLLSRFHSGLGNEYVWAKSGTDVVGYVNSPDPNAYPVDDGYTYTALGMLGEKVRIETGSYTGTGTAGSVSEGCSITFGFTPKLVLIHEAGNGFGSPFVKFGFHWGDTTALMYPAATGGVVERLSYSGDTVTWYCTDSVAYQLNTKGKEYRYIAIA